MRQAFFVMPYNSYDKIIGDALSDDFQYHTASSDNILNQMLNPGFQQEREFGQQVALQQMQNDWSVGGRLQAMKDAGINANVAAAGIAGNGSATTGSSNSAVGSGAQGVASAAQAAGAVNDAVNAGVNAYEKFSLTPSKKDETRANIRNLLSTALHNDWLAYAVSEMLPLQKDNERADTWLKLANFDKAREEKKLINKRIDEASAHIDELKSQAYFYEMQGDLTLFEQTKTLYETEQISLDNNKKQWEKEWRDKYKYDPNAPVDVALEQAMVNDADDSVVNVIGDSVKELSYNERKGFNSAEIEDAYLKAFSEYKAKTDIDADFAPYMAMIEANKQSIIEFIKMVTDNPDDIQGIIAKLFNLVGQFGLAGQLDNGVVNTAKKPNSGVTISNR